MKTIATLLFMIGLVPEMLAQPISYLWSNGDTTAMINVNPGQPTTYYVTITQNGVQYFDSLLVQPNFTSIQPAVSASGPTSFCSGGTVTLSAPAGFAYLWSTGATTPSISVSNTGSYTVRTISNGCTSAVSQAVQVTASTIPQVTISSQIADGEGFRLKGFGAEHYKWNLGYYGGPIVGEADSLLVNPSGTQLYTLKGWNDGNEICFDTSFIVVIGTSAATPNAPDFHVFPNPGNGLFELHSNSLQGVFRFRILDLPGRLMGEGEFQSGGTHLFDLRHLAAGIYSLQILSDGKPAFIRLKKE